MRTNARRIAQAALCIVPTVTPWSSVGNQMTLATQSRLWVNGTSTVRSFECKATEFAAAIETSGPGAAKAVAGGEKAVRTVSVTVPAARLDCDNNTMNEHMLKALKAKEHGTITFELSSYDVAPQGGKVQGTLKGKLTLGGVTKPITISAMGASMPDGTLHVTGTHELRMTDYGLKPPSLMMGTMKVHEAVKVSFDLILKG
ncbi:MAG TPA: YceI family protein [Gemmatimonadales bacterium]